MTKNQLLRACANANMSVANVIKHAKLCLSAEQVRLIEMSIEYAIVQAECELGEFCVRGARIVKFPDCFCVELYGDNNCAVYGVIEMATNPKTSLATQWTGQR